MSRREATRRSCLAAVAGLMALVPVRAREPDSSDADQKIVFNIAAQPIGSALEDLGRQSGLTLVMDSALRHRAITPKLAGQYTPTQALKLLLAEAGLRAVYLDPRTIMIVASEAEAEPPHASATKPDPSLKEAQDSASRPPSGK